MMRESDPLRFSHVAFILIVAALLMSFAIRVGASHYQATPTHIIHNEFHHSRPTPIPTYAP